LTRNENIAAIVVTGIFLAVAVFTALTTWGVHP